MKKHSVSQSGRFNPPVLLALFLFSVGVLLAVLSAVRISHETPRSTDRLEPYMPAAVGDADNLDRMKVEWNNRSAGFSTFGRLPIAFEPNVGQTDPAVRFLAHYRGGTIYFAKGEIVLAIPEKIGRCRKRSRNYTGQFSPALPTA